jgi:uncharacterized protein (TIGR00730 family)
MGALLAANQQTLVYGGGCVGLMGVLADAVLAGGGKVIGVIPQSLVDKEVGHFGVTELKVVASMHERKALMAELADAFVALPGGIGTLEELFEVWTWGQLGLHRKPCGLLNVNGFFGPLLAFLDDVTEQRFLRPEQRGMLQVASDPAHLLKLLTEYRPAVQPKWIDRKGT